MVLGFVFIGGKRTICEFDNLHLGAFECYFIISLKDRECCLEAVVAE